MNGRRSTWRGSISPSQIVGTVLKLSAPMRQHELGWPTALALAVLALAMMIWLRWPLVWVLLGLGGAACVFTYVVLRRRRPAALPPEGT